MFREAQIHRRPRRPERPPPVLLHPPRGFRGRTETAESESHEPEPKRMRETEPLDEEIPLPDAGDDVDDEGTARFEKRARFESRDDADPMDPKDAEEVRGHDGLYIGSISERDIAQVDRRGSMMSARCSHHLA